jgi:hypothetical protein
MEKKHKEKQPEKTVTITEKTWQELVDTAINTKCACGTCQLIRQLALGRTIPAKPE